MPVDGNDYDEANGEHKGNLSAVGRRKSLSQTLDASIQTREVTDALASRLQSAAAGELCAATDPSHRGRPFLTCRDPDWSADVRLSGAGDARPSSENEGRSKSGREKATGVSELAGASLDRGDAAVKRKNAAWLMDRRRYLDDEVLRRQLRCQRADESVVEQFKLVLNKLGELDSKVEASTIVEDVRLAVLRLKGAVAEAASLAGQLASARRQRLLCADRGRRRLPSRPPVTLPGHSATSDSRSDFGPRSAGMPTSSESWKPNFTGAIQTVDAFRMPRRTTPINRVEDPPCDDDLAPSGPRRIPVLDSETRTDWRIEDAGRRRTSTKRLLRVFDRDTDGDVPRDTLPNHAASRTEPVEELKSSEQYDCPAADSIGDVDCPLPSHSRYRRAVSCLLNSATNVYADFLRTLTVSFQTASCRLLNWWIVSAGRPAAASHSTTAFYVVGILFFVVVVLIVVWVCSDEISERCCDRTNNIDWIAAVWKNFGVRFRHRHVKPPPF